MNAVMPYTGAQLEIYEESVRLVPAILKAKRDGRAHDVFELYRGLIEDGAERDLSPEQVWAAFSSAAMTWTTSLFEGAAVRLGMDPDALLDQAINASAFWSASGH
jgi:hypothetical protein